MMLVTANGRPLEYLCRKKDPYFRMVPGEPAIRYLDNRLAQPDFIYVYFNGIALRLPGHTRGTSVAPPSMAIVSPVM